MRNPAPISKNGQPSVQKAIEVAENAPSLFTPEQWAHMTAINASAYLGLPPAPKPTQTSEPMPKG